MIPIILIPAMGRKQARGQVAQGRQGLYSSPQGDGNSGTTGMVASQMGIILIPARGRKQNLNKLVERLVIDYTHPRKGTETSFVRA